MTGFGGAHLCNQTLPPSTTPALSQTTLQDSANNAAELIDPRARRSKWVLVWELLAPRPRFCTSRIMGIRLGDIMSSSRVRIRGIGWINWLIIVRVMDGYLVSEVMKFEGVMLTWSRCYSNAKLLDEGAWVYRRDTARCEWGCYPIPTCIRVKTFWSDEEIRDQCLKIYRSFAGVKDSNSRSRIFPRKSW